MTNLSGINLNAASGGPQGGGMDCRRNALEQTVPEGYKQTEVGVIPEDWELVNFGDIVKYIKGYPFKSSEYTDSGIRVVRVSDTSFTTIKNDNPIYVSESSYNKYKKWSLSDGDLIFTTVGSKPPMYDSLVGKAILVEPHHKGFLLNQNAVLITPKSSAENISNLLVNHFRTERYIDHIEQIYRGNANQASITLDGLFEFKIPLSKSQQEQTAIANALSDVDALLTELEKLIAKKQAIKTATMQQLLTGKTRLPQFATYTEGEKKGQPKGTKPSELGEIPEDWDVYFLDQLITSTQLGGNYSNSEAESSFPLIKMGNLGRGKIKLDKLEYANEAVSARDRLKFDDVLFNTRNTLELVGKVAIWKDELPEAYFNSNIMRFVFNNNLVSSNSYMNAAMNTKKFVTDLAGIATGTTSVAAIYTRDLLQLKLLIPPKEEQTAIATILSDMDNEIQTLEQRLAKTRQIKQGMMQELLTGRTRLPFDREAQQGN